MSEEFAGFVASSGPLVPQLEQFLRTRIEKSIWAPAERIPSETVLATELGVRRSSIREAIRLLACAGVLEVRLGVGTFVADAAQLEHLDEFIRLRRRSKILEVFEVRRALEVEASRLAAIRVQPEDLDRLRRRLSSRHDHSEGNVEKFVDHDLDFHTEVVRLSGNAILLSLFESVRPLVRESIISLIAHETGLPDTSDSHDFLLDALADGNPAAAVTATQANIDTLVQRLRRLDS